MHLINHLLIIVKMYIYISKFGPSKLNILAVHNSIREVYDNEKNIVIRKSLNDKQLNFYSTYSPLRLRLKSTTTKIKF